MSTQNTAMHWWERDNAFWHGGFIHNLTLKPDDIEELRIQFLRNQFVQKPAHGLQGDVSIDRAILVTESYKETEGQPPVIRRARATEKILKNMPIRIYPAELIVGLTSTSQRNVNVAPEFQTNFLERELELDRKKMTELDAIPIREGNAYLVREEDKKKLREEVLPYWHGKNTYSHVLEELKRHHPEVYETVLYGELWDFVYRCESPANMLLDHVSILNKGLVGLKAEIEEQISKLTYADPGDFDRRDMYEAMKIVADGIVAYAHRYAKEAERLAETELDQERRKELHEIAKVCRDVPANPASGWWQALQSFWFMHSIPRFIENGSSYCAGRLDQYLHPFLEGDLRSGKISQKRAQALLECVWIKLNQVRYLYDYVDSKLTADFFDDDNITIGGVDSNGDDAANEVTYMMLEAEAHVHLPEPNLELRVHKNTPEKLLLSALEVLRLGAGKPQLVNDGVIVPSLLSRGLTLHEARNYASVGCQENTSDPNMTPEGDTFCRTNAGWWNLTKVIEYALNRGVNPNNGKQLGPRTADPRTFKTVKDLLDAIEVQEEYFWNHLLTLNNLYDRILSNQYPSPVVDLMTPGPRRSGVDRAAGGCKYNFTAPIAVGSATAADSLAAIEYIVFDKKIATMHRLLEALKNNWKGYEMLREQCRNAPKYGNDDEYADRFVRKRTSIFMDVVEKTRCGRGGPCFTGFFSVSAYFPLGWVVGASPDGRYAGEPLSDTISPANGMDRKGPTATHKSACRMDTLRITDGVIFNQRLSLGTVSTEADLSKWAALVRAYFDMGGIEVSYMVVNSKLLREAQEHPDLYEGLVVRVAGYSAFFVELTKEVQDSIIARTEHSW